ncbi:hypothetical protein [Borrelia sp. RT5S]|uniref:hypothetical protein n=1 Tax=Borrelia sp. RT5S TaxID=2898581 RepID=UPI001E333713|nr:hypothetical protein [Borrelia sp. RT5S]UGQ16808.1 hypothetical protein LSO06_05655 [Borrelia sp. RT5S]
MKKFSIMFFLVLVVALFACKQEEAGEGQSGTGSGAGAGGAAGGQSQSDEAGKQTPGQRDDARLAEETKTALTALKTKRDDYSTELKGLKTTYDALKPKNEVSIPSELKILTTRRHQPKIHASLGYDNELIKKLDESIKGLKISNATTHAKQIKTASAVLQVLVDLDDAIKKILDTYLKGANLTKIENDKDKIEKATAELNKFIASRKEFIESIQKTIEKAHTNRSDETNLKAELDKIADKTKTTANADESGYYHVTVEAIKKNVEALSDLVK